MSEEERREGKAEQVRAWDAVARGWGRQAAAFERAGGGVTERLLDLAGVASGSRVLDLACGAGEPALSAARRTGPGGRVLATDQAPTMVEVTRGRAAREGLAHLEALVSDMETLELPVRSFDAALCRFGLMFLHDLPSTLRRILGLLVPGGGFAASVWPGRERVACIDLPRKVALRIFDLPDCEEEEGPGPFRLSDAGELVRSLRRAGFAEVALERVSCPMDFASAAEYRLFLEDTSSRLSGLLAGHPPERGEELWAAIAEETRPYSDGEGRIRFPGEALLVSGRRPVSS
jgi:SAM-dependent methyltransferase